MAKQDIQDLKLISATDAQELPIQVNCFSAGFVPFLRNASSTGYLLNTWQQTAIIKHSKPNSTTKHSTEEFYFDFLNHYCYTENIKSLEDIITYCNGWDLENKQVVITINTHAPLHLAIYLLGLKALKKQTKKPKVILQKEINNELNFKNIKEEVNFLKQALQLTDIDIEIRFIPVQDQIETAAKNTLALLVFYAQKTTEQLLEKTIAASVICSIISFGFIATPDILQTTLQPRILRAIWAIIWKHAGVPSLANTAVKTTAMFYNTNNKEVSLTHKTLSVMASIFGSTSKMVYAQEQQNDFISITNILQQESAVDTIIDPLAGDTHLDKQTDIEIALLESQLKNLEQSYRDTKTQTTNHKENLAHYIKALALVPKNTLIQDIYSVIKNVS